MTRFLLFILLVWLFKKIFSVFLFSNKKAESKKHTKLNNQRSSMDIQDAEFEDIE